MAESKMSRAELAARLHNMNCEMVQLSDKFSELSVAIFNDNPSDKKIGIKLQWLRLEISERLAKIDALCYASASGSVWKCSTCDQSGCPNCYPKEIKS